MKNKAAPAPWQQSLDSGWRARATSFVIQTILAGLCLLLSPALAERLFANYGAIHFVAALAPHPQPFHHPLDPSSLSHLSTVISLGEVDAGAASTGLSCLILRALLAQEDWERALVLEAACESDPIYSDPSWQADMLALRGVSEYRTGQQRAAGTLHMALAVSDGIIGHSLAPYLAAVTGLGSQQSGWCQEHLEQLDLEPEVYLGRQSNTEWVRQPAPVGPDWMLAGLTVNEADLAASPVYRGLLFWTPTTPDMKPLTAWKRAGVFWVECRRLLNFVPNAGFEWSDPAKPSKPFMTDFSGQVQIELDRRTGLENHIAKVGTTTKAVHGLYPVEPGCYYLTAGRTAGTRSWPIIMGIWFSDILSRDMKKELVMPDERRWIVNGMQRGDFEWMSVAAIIAPPEGAVGIEPGFMNWRAPGWASFDNLILTPLAPPGTAHKCLASDLAIGSIVPGKNDR